MVGSGDDVDDWQSSREGAASDDTTSAEGDRVDSDADQPTLESDIETAREVAFRTARGRGLNLDDADDIAQTVAEKFFAARQKPDNVAAWAQRVAMNAVTDVARRRKIANDIGVWVDREGPMDVGGADTIAEVATFIRTQRAVSAQGMQRQAGQEMEALLRSRLNEREMLLLTLIAEGQSQQQIADSLGYAGADTVKTTLKRIRTKLQDLAGPLGEFRAHPRVY